MILKWELPIWSMLCVYGTIWRTPFWDHGTLVYSKRRFEVSTSYCAASVMIHVSAYIIFLSFKIKSLIRSGHFWWVACYKTKSPYSNSKLPLSWTLMPMIGRFLIREQLPLYSKPWQLSLLKMAIPFIADDTSKSSLLISFLKGRHFENR